MSKAFTRESDEAPEEPLFRPPVRLPPGVKNYITPAGARQLRAVLDRLVEVERPQAATLPDAAEAKHQLQLLDQRLAVLEQSLRTAEIVPPPAPPWGQVRFGATVNVRDRSGAEARYRIVGVDEIDLDRDWLSWRSPVAKALLNARLGQRVRFHIPAGEQELEIIAISYE